MGLYPAIGIIQVIRPLASVALIEFSWGFVGHSGCHLNHVHLDYVLGHNVHAAARTYILPGVLNLLVRLLMAAGCRIKSCLIVHNRRVPMYG